MCRGKSISIFDPTAGLEAEPYWKHQEDTNAEKIVPKGYEVRVIAAYIKFENDGQGNESHHVNNVTAQDREK